MVSGPAVGVGAGLLLRRPARGLYFGIFLALLATVRGGRFFAFALGRGFGRGADGRWSRSVLGCCCLPWRALHVGYIFYHY